MGRKQAFGGLLDVLTQTNISPSQVSPVSSDKTINKSVKHKDSLTERQISNRPIKPIDRMTDRQNDRQAEKRVKVTPVSASEYTPGKTKRHKDRLAERQINSKTVKIAPLVLDKIPSGSIKKIVINIAPGVHEKIKRNAIKSNKFMSGYVTEYLTNHLDKTINISKDTGKTWEKHGLTLYIPVKLFTDIKLKAVDLHVPYASIIENILKSA